MRPSLVWFRQDLRLADNPALQAAVDRGEPIIPIYIWSPEEEEGWAPGGASQWWLHGSLKALAADLETLGSRLVLRSGRALPALQKLARQTGAGAVFWNRRYEPAAVERDRQVEQALAADGLEAKSFKGSVLWEPWEIATQAGTPYKVFTPFYNACLRAGLGGEPLMRPSALPAPESWPDSEPLSELDLEPQRDWTDGIRKEWTPGEDSARETLRRFLRGGLGKYSRDRDVPSVLGTAQVSPHLCFGEISPRQAWVATGESGGEAWKRQLVWREFGRHLLFHFPRTADEPLRPEFVRFPWKDDPAALQLWQKGQTGYPIVDAGMRQLWETGWMHNRVRMIVASFLVKDLMIPWQEGARWFWDTLVDADLANNTLGWQWTAGCGADAAPYFRVLNPMSQGQKFDPKGKYVRRWVPELESLSAKDIHEPWNATDAVLKRASVELGKDYPYPIVDHAEARTAALDAYGQLRGDTRTRR
ncbi:MAG: deoxyribodipyrimidine photo-lyase [Acidobacteria bacterium]|nr:deoxyribodipyrimidine photo-lyase [Acidobacteriota bacterium]